MAESVRSRRKTEDEPMAFIPSLLERIFGVVEVFSNGFLRLLSDTAEDLFMRSVQRLFGLLLLGVGIVFVLTGASKILNELFRFPGVGELMVGVFLLFVTSMVLLMTRRR